MTNPKLQECANHLARDFQRVYDRHSAKTIGADLPPQIVDVLAKAFYSLLYSGIILCPRPEHRIGISLRQEREPTL